MANKDEKYYDPVNYYPKPNFKRNDGTTSVLKTIRVPPEELENWNVARIHELLKGENLTNDANMNGELKELLKFLYGFLSEKCDVTGNIIPEDIEKLEQIKDKVII